jgi:hypothetical protein
MRNARHGCDWFLRPSVIWDPWERELFLISLLAAF